MVFRNTVNTVNVAQTQQIKYHPNNPKHETNLSYQNTSLNINPIIILLMENVKPLLGLFGKNWKGTADVINSTFGRYSSAKIIGSQVLLGKVVSGIKIIESRFGKVEIVSYLGVLGRADERIIKATLYKTPLSDSQLTNFLFNHQYVVLQTESQFLSFEKTTQGVIIQVSRQEEEVRDYRNGKKRCKSGSYFKWLDWVPEQIQSKKGKNSINTVFDLATGEEMKEKAYHFFLENCKDYAQMVYEMA